ncbi:MAG: alpha/beta hydrolase family protein [Planctomycetaceae bacterium]
MLGEAPQKGTSRFVKAWLDKEAEAVPFSTYVFLAATPDICTFDSQAGETYGDRFGPGYSEGWAGGIRSLRAEGTDALKVVTEHMHAKGKEVLAAIRMSDTHHRSLDPDNPGCPKFAMEHPQLVIKQPDGRTNETALDYSHEEVREHRLAIMREIAQQYDVDGLELNFARWAKHFPRDQGRKKAPIMTKYVGQIREMLDAAAVQRRRDHLTLGVRVPESIAACWLAGVDIETWVRRGWIDYVVITTWNNTDPQLPVDQFTRFTKPAGVDTIAVMGNMIGSIYRGPPSILDRPIAMSAKHKPNSYLGMLLTESEARGAAANYYTWGADSISFWNVGIHFGGEVTAVPEQQARITSWTQAVKSKESVFAGPRTYRYLPMGKGISSRKPPARNYPWYDEGRSPLGHINSQVLTFDQEHTGKQLVFPFRMADGAGGEKLSGQLTFWIYYLLETDEIDIAINGKLVDPAKIKRNPAGKRRGGLRGQRLEISLADCPPFRGDNQLGLTLKEKPAVDQGEPPYLEELEVVVNGNVDGEHFSARRPLKNKMTVNSRIYTHLEKEVERLTPKMAWQAATPAEHGAWRGQFKARLIELLGPDPESVPLEVKWAEKLETDAFTRHKIYVRSEVNYWIPAYYYVPKNVKGRRPAIVCFHGHSGINPYIREGTEAEKKKGQEHALDYAVVFAEHGYVTVAVVQRGWNETRHEKPHSCQRLSRAGFLIGRTPIGMRCWDGSRVVDFLETRDEVDPVRIAAAGLSGGGTTTLFFSAIEDRIKLAMCAGYYCTLKDSIYSIHHCICNCVPHLMEWAEMSDIGALIAPRPMLVISGSRDRIFPIDATKRAFEDLARTYHCLGVPDHLESDFFEGVHQWSNRKTLPFLATHFGK